MPRILREERSQLCHGENSAPECVWPTNDAFRTCNLRDRARTYFSKGKHREIYWRISQKVSKRLKNQSIKPCAEIARAKNTCRSICAQVLFYDSPFIHRRHSDDFTSVAY
jgi:hypothetical protein